MRIVNDPHGGTLTLAAAVARHCAGRDNHPESHPQASPEGAAHGLGWSPDPEEPTD